MGLAEEETERVSSVHSPSSGTNWWVDPAEDLAVVFLAHSPGPIRWHYRRVINAPVYGALMD